MSAVSGSVDSNSVVLSTTGGFPKFYDNEGKWDEG